jgi:hypothetical protein
MIFEWTSLNNVTSDQYIPPDEEEKIDIENCTPLIFSFMNVDALVTLFS